MCILWKYKTFDTIFKKNLILNEKSMQSAQTGRGKNNMPSGHSDKIYILTLVYVLKNRKMNKVKKTKKHQWFVTQIITACLTAYMPSATCCSFFGHSVGHDDSKSLQGPRRLSHRHERERFCRPATSSALWERWRMKLNVVSSLFWGHAAQ